MNSGTNSTSPSTQRVAEFLLANLGPRLGKPLMDFHKEFESLIDTAAGSTHNHQAWFGGYSDHIGQCFWLAWSMYRELPRLWDKAYPKMPFQFESVVAVLYLHDIEKIWRHNGLEVAEPDYETYLTEKRKIPLTDEELNALKYIHGEGSAYRKDRRVMNELAGFCHAVDVLSARTFWNRGIPG